MKRVFTLLVCEEGDNIHEGRMLQYIYDELMTGSNLPAFKCV